MASQRFEDIRTGLTRLRSLYLPAHRRQPNDPYTDDEYDRALAYPVMAHAEFEQYIEDRAKELVLETMRFVKVTGMFTPTAVALVSLLVPPVKIPETLGEFEKNEDSLCSQRQSVLSGVAPFLVGSLEKAVETFSGQIGRNHGVKEKNLLTMLLPLGLDTRRIDNLWLKDMSDFGSRRGTLAHKRMGAIKSVLDPFTDLAAVEKLAYYSADDPTKSKYKIDCLEALDDFIEIELKKLRVSSLPSTQQISGAAKPKTWWRRLIARC